MRLYVTAAASLCLLTTVVSITAEDHSHHDHMHHDHGAGIHSDAPIGVMGGHMHGAGDWMLSYRFMRMRMDGMLDGTDSVSTSDLLNMTGDYQYMMVPTEMSMDMHMLGAMYGLNDKLTLMAMVNYIDNTMDMERRMGVPLTFSTESSGLGDISIGALYLLQADEKKQFHAQVSLSLPSGSIEEEDDTPMGNDMQLPYAMQLGSGTFDLKPGITYLGVHQQVSWGAQANLVLRLGENDQEYTLGNRTQLTSWIAYNKIPEATMTARLDYQDWGDIDGEAKDLMMMPAMNPNADPDLRGGSRLDLGLGLSSTINKHRLSVELLFPLLQDLNGPQMEVKMTSVFGYQFYF